MINKLNKNIFNKKPFNKLKDFNKFLRNQRSKLDGEKMEVMDIFFNQVYKY